MPFYCKLIGMEFHFYKGAYGIFHRCTIFQGFHWMVQLCSEILIFLMFIFLNFHAVLIHVSMAYCASVIGALLYLLKENFSLLTAFFYFLDISNTYEVLNFVGTFLYCFLISGFDFYLSFDPSNF